MKYVHRDISTGNILFYQGGGLLSDLEFLKKISSLESHEIKIVRALFILLLWRLKCSVRELGNSQLSK
jgi:hypothetical protein